MAGPTATATTTTTVAAIAAILLSRAGFGPQEDPWSRSGLGSQMSLTPRPKELFRRLFQATEVPFCLYEAHCFLVLCLKPFNSTAPHHKEQRN